MKNILFNIVILQEVFKINVLLHTSIQSNVN
jgi:hypothetical protein